MLGNDIEQGSLPNDIDLIGGMVTDICYANAKKYFGFNV
jgi:glucuronate isomerase